MFIEKELTFVTCIVLLLTLKMAVVYSIEMSVNLYRTTRRHISENAILLLANKTKISVALSPQANYTDWATATCRRS
jgi:GTP1/Obg family GTP-binding protein